MTEILCLTHRADHIAYHMLASFLKPKKRNKFCLNPHAIQGWLHDFSPTFASGRNDGHHQGFEKLVLGPGEVRLAQIPEQLPRPSEKMARQ